MPWQEDLAELDKTLAEGRISADEYRRRRDEILASATNAQPPAQQQNPFGQPFRWEAARPQEAQPAGNPEQTQVVGTGAAAVPADQNNPEKTQVVRAGNPDAERTQFVRPVQQTGGFPPPQQPQQPQQPNWQAGPTTPPWGGDSFGDGGHGWIAQGPEVFDDKPSGKGKKILAIIGVVAVLAGIGVGVYFLTAGKSDEAAQPGTSSTPTTSVSASTAAPTTTTSAGPKLPLEGVKGKLDSASSGETTVSAAQQKSQFSPDEATLMTNCGAKAGLAQVLFQTDWYTQVHVFKCGDSTTAATAAKGLMELQAGYGFGPGTGPSGLAIMFADKATDVPDVPFDQRAFYSSGTSLIRIEVRGRTKEAANTGMSEVYAAITKGYPAK
ncbi:hypothetical protein [Actinosynnema sp. NPDC020468]|uniref:hypothetical protein n=1 Tax=Actinosynnema sp. NPDC020468 TaxID=3154488 RepID=UPI0033F9A610